MTGLLIFTLATIGVAVACIFWDRHASGYSDAPMVVGSIAALIAFVTGIVCGVYWLEDRTCGQKGEALDRESQFGMFTGCLVETDSGQMVPLDNLRFNESGEVVLS